VIDGRWRFVLEEQRIDAIPGLVMLPRGVLHAYGCLEDGRVLSWATPGGMEQMFLDAGAPADGPPIAPAVPRIGCGRGRWDRDDRTPTGARRLRHHVAGPSQHR
jgi:hypothetical protein